MGKKQGRQRKQKRKKKISWPTVVLVGALLITAAFLFANRRGISKHGSGPPKIAVDQQRIDYGYVRYGVNKSFDIEVTNVGGAALRFTEKPYVKVLKGC